MTVTWLKDPGHIYHIPAKLWIWAMFITFAEYNPFVFVLFFMFSTVKHPAKVRPKGIVGIKNSPSLQLKQAKILPLLMGFIFWRIVPYK